MTPHIQFSNRGPILGGMIALGALVAFGATWGMQTEISGAVIAQGMLQVPDHRQNVQHVMGGTIETLHVRNGDAVTAGQVLVTLDTAAVEQAIADKSMTLMQDQAEIARLQASLAGQSKIQWPRYVSDPTVRELQQGLLDSEIRKIADRNAKARAELSLIDQTLNGLGKQFSSIQRQHDLGQSDLEAKQALHGQGIVNRPVIVGLQQAQERLTLQLAEISTQISVQRGRQVQIAVAKTAVETDVRSADQLRLAGLVRQSSVLTAELAQLRLQQDRSFVTAPTGGVVIDMAFFGPGAVIQPAVSILQIVPNSTDLSVAAKISTNHIDQVHLGQTVTIVMAGLADKTLPQLDARVTGVAADAIPDPRTGHLSYDLTIQLAPETLEALSEHTLVPGMPAEAHIQTGLQRPIDLLFEPVKTYFTRAFKQT
ncbi:MAG: HlyD family type I secretion periplasmic adaptor subunit [Planktomarina sp.]